MFKQTILLKLEIIILLCLFPSLTNLHLNNKLKVINKSLKVIRSRKREARDIENYAERSIRMQELMDKERSLIMDFNKVYDKLKDNE